MTTRASKIALGMVIIVGLTISNISAVSADAMCKDGTTSESVSQGACSYHGGVEYWIESYNDDGTTERVYPAAEGKTIFDWFMDFWFVAAIVGVGAIFYCARRESR